MTGKPSAGSARTGAGIEGVDAHAANEFDTRHGLAGAEAKPFGKARSPAETRETGEDVSGHPKETERDQQGLVERPTGQFPPSGQQGAGADRPDNADP